MPAIKPALSFVVAISFNTVKDVPDPAVAPLSEPAASDVARLAREIREYGLRDLFGELRRTDLAQGLRIDQVQMPADDGGKGCFGLLPGVLLQQIKIGRGHL